MGKITKWNDPGDHEAQHGREPAGARRSRSSTALTARARPTTSPTTSREVSPAVEVTGRRGTSARSTGRRAASRRALPASPAPSGRRPGGDRLRRRRLTRVQNHLELLRDEEQRRARSRSGARASWRRRRSDAFSRQPAKDELSIVNPPEQKYPLAYPICDLHVRGSCRRRQARRPPTSRSSSFWAVTKGQKFGPKLHLPSRSRSRCVIVDEKADREDPL